jgi:hypothetical protein
MICGDGIWREEVKIETKIKYISTVLKGIKVSL